MTASSSGRDLRAAGFTLFLLLAAFAGRTETAKADLADRLDRTGVMAGKFIFAKGASQGPEEWYVGSFRMRLRLPPTSPPGEFKFEASVDGFSSNYVKGVLRRGGPCGDRTLVLTSVDLFRGQWREVRCDDSVELVSRNFLQDRAVRPGRAGYRITAEGLRSHGIEVNLLSSGIQPTPRGPARMTIAAAKGEEVEVHAGEWEPVPVALVNIGERPLRNLVGRVAAEGADVRPNLAGLPEEIAPHNRHVSRFWIRAPRRGLYNVTVTASSTSNSPAAEFELVVKPSEGASLPGDLRFAALILAGVAILIFLGSRALARGYDS